MRRINKGEPIAEFQAFLKGNPQSWDNDFQDKQRYPALSTNCREHILVYEQDCQSGYTEMPLDTDSETHIDHYRKKGMQEFRHLMFDWNNFVVDSRDTYYGACHKDKVVNNPMIYNEIFDPVADDVENFFYYNGDGSIIPLYTLSDQDKQKVIKTVEVFNLNHRTLKNRRAELLKELEEWGGSLSDNEVKAAFSKYGFKSVLEQKLRERRVLEMV